MAADRFFVCFSGRPSFFTCPASLWSDLFPGCELPRPDMRDSLLPRLDMSRTSQSALRWVPRSALSRPLGCTDSLRHVERCECLLLRASFAACCRRGLLTAPAVTPPPLPVRTPPTAYGPGTPSSTRVAMAEGAPPPRLRSAAYFVCLLRVGLEEARGRHGQPGLVRASVVSSFVDGLRPNSDPGASRLHLAKEGRKLSSRPLPASRLAPRSLSAGVRGPPVTLYHAPWAPSPLECHLASVLPHVRLALGANTMAFVPLLSCPHVPTRACSGRHRRP